MINKVTLIGNLGRDPEVRHLENGSAVARFSVATNESYRDKDGNWQNQTEWHIVVAWRYLAETAERDLKKGSMVFIEGKLSSRTYTDPNGVEKTITEVEAQVLKSLDKKERNDNSFPSADDEPMNFRSSNTSTPPASTSTPSTTSNSPVSPTSSDSNEGMDVADDLPF